MIGPQRASCAPSSTCHHTQPFPYVWRSEAAPFDFIVCALLIVIVLAAWCSLVRAVQEKEKR